MLSASSRRTIASRDMGEGLRATPKRVSPAIGDEVIGGFLSGAVFTSIFRQDPRYFYQGTGSVKSRLIQALSWAVIPRSDKGRSIPEWLDMLGDLAEGAVSNLYYPGANRGWASSSQASSSVWLRDKLVNRYPGMKSEIGAQFGQPPKAA
jgi:hypothetical protein